MTANEVYAILKKKIQASATGITNIAISNGNYIFTLGDGSTVSVPVPSDHIIISKEDYNSLSNAEKLDTSKTYFVYDEEDAVGQLVTTIDENSTNAQVPSAKAIWDLLASGAGSADAKLAKDITSNLEVGGIPSNTTVPKDTDFTTFVEQLLVKKIKPMITLSTTATLTREIGNGLAAGAIFTMTLTNPSATTELANITDVEFYENGNLVDTQAFVQGTNSYRYTTTAVISSNTKVEAKLIYGSENVSANKTVSFVNASYYGTTSISVPTDADITGMSKSIKSSKAFTWNNINCSDEYLVYAYPKSFGALTSIKDSNNFEYLGSFNRTEVTISGVVYYCYTQADAVTFSGFKYIFA